MKLIYLLSVIFFMLMSCEGKVAYVTNYLDYKTNLVLANVERSGNKKSDIILKDEMIRVLKSIEVDGVLSQNDIEKLKLTDYRKDQLIVLSDTINHSNINTYKLFIVDFYNDEILSNKICFDRVKTLAVKTSVSNIDLYLTADKSHILPNVYYSVGDSALKVVNQYRTDNPFKLNLDSIKFDMTYDESLKSNAEIFGYYMIPSSKGDTAFTIRKDDIINAY